MNTKKPLPTLEDVAAAAGVSTATVSRALHRPEAVAEALRRQVLATVEKLGYVPHAGARSLMLRRSGTVGAVFPTVDNAIFAKAIDALQRRLAEASHPLVIATSDYNPVTEARQVMNLLSCGVDALVLCGCGQSEDLVQLLRQRSVPVVHTMTWPGVRGRICVGFDNAQAMGKAARYVLDLGHRRVAMLAGITKDNDRAAARVRGARDTLREAGVKIAGSMFTERRYNLAEAREGFRLLMRNVPRPTAIICGNDVLALGALFEAQRMGISVPGELSIVGFDDLELASQVNPALTTVHVPAEEMWRTAADRVIAALNGNEVAQETEIDVSLVVRESSGPPPPRRKS